jgi:hypothetical protein
MKTIIVSFGVLALLVLPAAGQDKEEERVANAGTVISEIMNIPDNVPQDTIDKADCVVVLPSVLKLAFGIGGSYGRGVMTCRGGETFHGPWSAPTMMALEGGSFGLQLGGQATDFVLLLMSPKSASNILGSRVNVNNDALYALFTLASRKRSDICERLACSDRNAAFIFSLQERLPEDIADRFLEMGAAGNEIGVHALAAEEKISAIAEEAVMHAFHFSKPRCTEEFFDYVRAHDGNRTWTFALLDALWTEYQVTSV